MLEPLRVLLDQVRQWADQDPAVRSVALVGSPARGTARPDSDVDLLILTMRPAALLEDFDWVSRFGRASFKTQENWGRVSSVRVWYATGLEVEFGVTQPDWITEPDEGTHRVVNDGLVLLLDKDGAFASWSIP